jgi:hypothetical protein
MRYLVKAKVLWDGKDTWTIISDKNGTRVFRGNKEAFTKFLRKIKAKDNLHDPRSFRSLTYAGIVDEIISGKDNIIYVWGHHFPDKKKPIKVYNTMKEGVRDLIPRKEILPSNSVILVIRNHDGKFVDLIAEKYRSDDKDEWIRLAKGLVNTANTYFSHREYSNIQSFIFVTDIGGQIHWIISSNFKFVSEIGTEAFDYTLGINV